MNWYLKVLKQYVDFKGRARRKEFWMFALFNVIFACVAFGLDKLCHTTAANGSGGMFSSLYSLAVFIPGLAVAVRRLHDVGKSGWMYFIALIPIVGWIWILVLFVTNSQPGENQWGPNPKGE
ncbi:MAG: DUF805 domain-containing protein [Dysgonamonadaceae bacterium]|jgi:uncharacterized membrane protein YhaH (DUF805 family)|nr:DUF805 domain-containing protein [Dysgonamonadaceae bacterium]